MWSVRKYAERRYDLLDVDGHIIDSFSSKEEASILADAHNKSSVKKVRLDSLRPGDKFTFQDMTCIKRDGPWYVAPNGVTYSAPGEWLVESLVKLVKTGSILIGGKCKYNGVVLRRVNRIDMNGWYFVDDAWNIHVLGTGVEVEPCE